MKKKYLAAIAVGLFFLACLCLGIKQYMKVNSQGQEAVKEKIFHKNQWVNTKNIRLKIFKIENRSTVHEKKLKVFLRVRQNTNVNMGGIEGNMNISDASWLNIPYGICNPSETVRKVNGKPFTEKELKSSTEKTMVLDFDSPVDNYEMRNSPARVSFLLSDGQNNNNKVTKYSLLVNL